MDWDDITGSWENYKQPILERWVRLTEDEVDEIEGRRSALAQRIAERYKVDVETADAEIEEWFKRLDHGNGSPP